MKFRLEVKGLKGNLIGTIDSALWWTQTDKLDRVGSFCTAIPIAELSLNLIEHKFTLTCVSEEGHLLGEGIVNQWRVNYKGGVIPVLEISGGNRLEELTYRVISQVRTPRLYSASELISLVSGWSWHSQAPSVSILPIDETVFSALIQATWRTGQHFRLTNSRTIEWLTELNQTDILLSTFAEVSDRSGLVTSLKALKDVHGLTSRVYPYGAGNGEARITLRHSTRTPPPGYSVDRINNFIRNNELESSFRIERVRSFKDITPPHGISFDDPSVANALFDTALNWLKTMDKVYRFYKVTVVTNATILPGDVVKLQSNAVPGLDIDIANINEQVVVLSVTRRVNQGGVFVINLEVANVPRWPDTDAEAQMRVMRAAQTYQAYNQPISSKVVRQLS